MAHLPIAVCICSVGIGTAAIARAAPSAIESSPNASGGAVPAATPEREKVQPTLLSDRAKVTGYGGADVAYTRMFHRSGALLGLQGAVVIDHRLHLGLAGYGWTNPPDGPDGYYGESQSYQTVYLGPTVRYTFLERGPFVITAGALLGGGAIVLTSDDRDYDDNYDRDDVHREGDVFAVFQPDLALHANVTRWMRAGLSAGYRVTSGIGEFSYEESDVNGFVVGGGLQFGWF